MKKAISLTKVDRPAQVLTEAHALSLRHPELTVSVYQVRRLAESRVRMLWIRFEKPRYQVVHDDGCGFALSPFVCFVAGEQLNPLACA